MSIVESYQQGTPCWADLSTTDFEASKGFYSQLFGWEFEDMPVGNGLSYSMAKKKGEWVTGMMAKIPGMDDSPSFWATYLAVDDADQAAAQVAGAGGQLLMPVDEVPNGSGRMFLASDPAGAVIGFWEAGNHRGSGLVNEPGAVIWNELTVPDPAAVTGFYQAVVGMESSTAPAGDLPSYTEFLVGGKSIAGATTPAMLGVPPHWGIYFNVANVDETLEQAQASGGSVVAPAFDVPGIGRMAVLADPTGAMFSLMSA
ncbi:hypothetical protein FHU41_001885 [Psychromicrobium silvestre]|uniref:VOC domain-containing protein n=1 Tax=Psychromicrobium silvestre TaxID=1645614 RepID=A0A7Y9LU33_9MICC|nr:VOC family protein [Psychromicrobium silvestre]NYE95635.1 hypothetical protein [Psychromicrobium silvestre]